MAAGAAQGIVVGEGGVGERDRPAAGEQGAPWPVPPVPPWPPVPSGSGLSTPLPPVPPWALSWERVELVKCDLPAAGEQAAPERVLAVVTGATRGGAICSIAALCRVIGDDDVVEREGAAVVEVVHPPQRLLTRPLPSPSHRLVPGRPG